MHPYRASRPLPSQARSASQTSQIPQETRNEGTSRTRDDRAEPILGDQGTCTCNASSQGGSPNYHVGAIASTGVMRMLQQQTVDLRAHVQSLQAQIKTQQFVNPQYHVCSWEHVRPHMRLIPKHLMLGLDPTRSKMKPSEEHMKEAILDIFEVSSNDKVQRKAFDRAWVKEIKNKVLTTFNNRRGRFSTSARNEL